MGLQATASEVRAAIAKIPAFQNKGNFDLNRYKAVLFQNRMTPEDFEQQMADDITATNAEVFIMGQAIVTKAEIESSYHFDNDRIKLAYVLFDPSSFEAAVKVDNAALEAFYKKNRDKYMEPEKRQIAYVVINSQDLEKSIQPTEGQIKQYYDENGAEFTHGKEVHARRILLRIKPGASGAEIKKANAEAAKILAEARQGKDFASLAKKYSQDAATAKNGGDLGVISSQKMSAAFSKAAFALKPGEMSPVVHTPSGLNIIKVEEVKKAGTETLDQARARIVKELKAQGARDQIYKDAQNLRDEAYAMQDMDKAALKLKMKVSAPVWITMSEKQSPANPFPRGARAKLFELGQGDVSDMLKIPGGYIVAQVKSIQKPVPAPFAKVKDKVASDFRLVEGRKLALKQASATLESARQQNGLAAAAKAVNASVTQSGYFSRQSPDKGLKMLQGTNLDAVFSLDKSNPFPKSALQVGAAYMVCQFGGKEPAGAPSKQRMAEISHIIMQQKRDVVWRTWLGEIAKTTKVQYLKKI